MESLRKVIYNKVDIHVWVQWSNQRWREVWTKVRSKVHFSIENQTRNLIILLLITLTSCDSEPCTVKTYRDGKLIHTTTSTSTTKTTIFKGEDGSTYKVVVNCK